MSLSLVKYQTDEGYPYSPTSQKLMNFTVPNTSNPVDFSKSYIVCNVSLTGVTNVGTYGFFDTSGSQLKPVAMFKNAKLWSNNNNNLYDEVRNVNVLAHNRDFYSEDVDDYQTRKFQGMGVSEYDYINLTRKTLFSRNFFLVGDELSTLSSANVIVPLSDIWADIGSMRMFPSHILDTRMEIELEDTISIINYDTTEGAHSFTIGINLAASTQYVCPMRVFSYLDEGVTKSPFYVGQYLRFVGSGMTNVTVTATPLQIIEIEVSDGSDTDAWGNDIPVGGLKIKLSGNVLVISNTTNVITDLQAEEVAPTGNTPSYIINDASLVLCERKLSPQIMEQYNSELLKNGLVYQRWISENFNMSGDTFQKFFDIDPMTSVVLISTPINDIFSYVANEINSYRLEWNNKETSNRNITINNDADFQSLYGHKVLLGVNRTGKKLKNLSMGTNFAQIFYSETSKLLSNIWEPIPEISSVSSLKVSINSTTLSARNGSLYKLVRRKVNFA